MKLASAGDRVVKERSASTSVMSKRKETLSLVRAAPPCDRPTVPTVPLAVYVEFEVDTGVESNLNAIHDRMVRRYWDLASHCLVKVTECSNTCQQASLEAERKCPVDPPGRGRVHDHDAPCFSSIQLK